ncbi:MAG TPA: hypothetical protein PKI03_37610 [Pseudomonadota bacterium]|nr:hypothetical protein [Pseudomonadota bacterium]
MLSLEPRNKGAFVMVDIELVQTQVIDEQESSASCLLVDCFAALNAAHVGYLVLHGYEHLPREFPHEIDMVVNRSEFQKALAILESSAHQHGWAVVNYVQHEHTAVAMELARQLDSGHVETLTLDLCSDYCWSGIVYLDNDSLLRGRRAFRGFYVPAAATELTYLLAKRVLKRTLQPEHEAYLADLFETDPVGARKMLSRLWDGVCLDFICTSLAQRRGALLGNLKALRSPLGNRALRRTLRQRPWAFVLESNRLLRRIYHPIGYTIAFLGPDGAGKTTVASLVAEELKRIFRGTEIIHFPFRLSRQAQAITVVPDPHGNPNRSMAASLIKLVYYVVTSVFGHYTRIQYLTARNRLVIYDRCFYDLVADPRRYRFGAPLWLARLSGLVVPQAECTIVLDAPVEVLRARKQEVPPEEVSRQRQEYQMIAQRLPRTRLIDASRPLQDVVAGVNSALLSFLAHRASEQKRSLRLS